MADCCYVAPTNVLNLADSNICGMVLGGIIAFPNGTIYRRTDVTIPCETGDYTIETFTGGSGGEFSFIISDGTNTQTVNDGETVTFVGQNGAKVTVQGTDTVVIDGLTTRGTAVPSSPPTDPTQVNFYYRTTDNSLYGWNPVSSSWQLLIAGAAGTGSPLPVADFTVSQRALTAALDATSSTSTQQGITITYAWTCSPSSGVSFSAPTGSTTNVTFPSPGVYTVTLTVTDSLSHTQTYSKIVNASRILHVKGAMTDVNGFNKLQDAIDWITTNDSSNAGLYSIIIHSPTDDTTTINVTNNAKLLFEQGATVNYKLSIASNAGLDYYWSGVSQSWIAINAGAANGIDVPTNTRLYLNNIRINSDSKCIAMNGNTMTLNCANVHLSGTGTGIDDSSSTGSNIYILDKMLIETDNDNIIINASSTITFGKLILKASTGSNMNLANCDGEIHAIHAETNSTTKSAIVYVNNSVRITHSFVRMKNASATSNSIAGIHLSGASSIALLEQNFVDGYNATGIIVLDTITSANVTLDHNTFRGSVASIGYYSSPPTGATWSNARVFHNLFEGTIAGTISYITTTSASNNNTTL